MQFEYILKKFYICYDFAFCLPNSYYHQLPRISFSEYLFFSLSFLFAGSAEQKIEILEREKLIPETGEVPRYIFIKTYFASRVLKLTKMNCNRRSVRWIFDCGKWYPTRQEWITASTSVQSEEKERIGRFFFKRDAKNSMCGRLLMRKFLTVHSRLRWKDIEILRGEHGKPYFANKDETPSLNFNISHQGNYAVLAGEVGDVAVGVDVMTVDYKTGNSLLEFLRLMQKQFSEDEWKIMEKCNYSDRETCRTFYRLWCLKESYLKATGSGLTESLRDISFNIKDEIVEEDKFITSTEVMVGGELQTNWCFHEILIDPDTFAAVALSPKCEPLTNGFEHLTFEELVNEAEEITSFDEEYCDNFFKKPNLPSGR